MQLPEGLTLAFVGNLPPIVAERVDYRWLQDEVAAVNQLNQQALQLTRPGEPTVRYAEAEPTPARERSAPPSSPETPPQAQQSQAPEMVTETTPAPESTPRKKRRRNRKRKGSAPDQAAENPRRRRNIPGMRETFPSSLEAAAATFRDQGGNVERIEPCTAAVTGGGMPYRVYRDGKLEVAVCEVRGTGHYFTATFEELGLEPLQRRSQA